MARGGKPSIVETALGDFHDLLARLSKVKRAHAVERRGIRCAQPTLRTADEATHHFN
jgi:hypothetical protein